MRFWLAFRNSCVSLPSCRTLFDEHATLRKKRGRLGWQTRLNKQNGLKMWKRTSTVQFSRVRSNEWVYTWREKRGAKQCLAFNGGTTWARNKIICGKLKRKLSMSILHNEDFLHNCSGRELFWMLEMLPWTWIIAHKLDIDTYVDMKSWVNLNTSEKAQVVQWQPHFHNTL